MTVRNPGGTAMIFYGPIGAGRRGLGDLLSMLTQATLGEEIAFVQAMLDPGADADVKAFVQAGYVFLAELIYLRRELSAPAEEPPTGLTWKSFDSTDEDRLARVIEETYVGSQDCPGLRGLRSMKDVVAGHKASGIFRPQSWWIPTLAGEPVGCVLVNGCTNQPDADEVVYIGVRPDDRRRGLGRAMLRHALSEAWQRGIKEMNIAADSDNTPAVRLYEQEGFGPVDWKQVFIKRATAHRQAGDRS